MMTPEELAAIKARAEAATPGPWSYYASPTSGGYKIQGIEKAWFYEATASTNENADFITHAREDVPALVAEVERLRAALVKIAYNDYVEQNKDTFLSAGQRAYETARRALGLDGDA